MNNGIFSDKGIKAIIYGSGRCTCCSFREKEIQELKNEHIHDNKMARAATHDKQVEDLVASEVFVL